MKIYSQGEKPSIWLGKRKCSCGCEFELEKDDIDRIKFQIIKFWDKSLTYAMEYHLYYLQCPNCGKVHQINKVHQTNR